MVEKTLAAMRRGGIFDHLGYGFHRYSTDPDWKVPHFEKMLYDQAMLCLAYTEASQITGDFSTARVVEEIIAYVERDLTAPEGVFYAAEDADSEGAEGTFYVFGLDEVREILGQEHAADADFAARVFNLEAAGNFEDEASGRRSGDNIPHLTATPKTLAEREGLDLAAFEQRLERIRAVLFTARAKRVRPHRDEKILTDWNGLMIAALALAGRAMQRKEWIEAAARAADYLAPEGTSALRHSFASGRPNEPAFLDDYAFLARGCLELHQATLDNRWLARALALTERQIELFWDNEKGGFFFTPAGDELPLRLKDPHDGAYPSGASVSLHTLTSLSRLLDHAECADKARRLAQAHAAEIRRSPTGSLHFLSGLLLDASPRLEVVAVPRAADAAHAAQATAEALALLGPAHAAFAPATLFLKRDALLDDLAPWTRALGPAPDKPTAHVRRDGRVTATVTRAEDLGRILG